MVHWAPDPPRDVEEHISMPAQVVVVESDESEDEVLGNGPPGYELLPQELTTLSSDEEEQSETEANDSEISTSNQSQDIPTTSESLARRQSEVEEVDHLYSTPAVRTEMTVDCEQVRAAMAGFSLPPSAIPAWAAAVPESQWAATLAQQIRRIQDHQLDNT